MTQDSAEMEPVNVHCATWNVNARDFPEGTDVSAFLGGADSVSKQKVDVFAIGFQEVSSRVDKFLFDTLVSGEDPWSSAVRGALVPHGYVKFRTNRLLGIVLNVFCLRKHLKYLRNVETQFTRLSMGGYLGLKGAVSVRFELYGVSYCFVNAHLSAHDHQLQLRIDEYNTVVEDHKFKNADAENILYHDYIIWMGDLNFRLQEGSFTHEEIVDKIRNGQMNRLLEADQLAAVRRDQVAFHELSDVVPAFPPTYKFVIDSDDYDSKRRPAWTDRILFRANVHNYEDLGDDVRLELTAGEYSSHCEPQFRCSDHRPVSLALKCMVFGAGFAELKNLLGYGPAIRFEPPSEPWHVNEDGNFSYAVDHNAGQLLEQWDWIGLYHENFTSLEDYVTFCWASSCRRTGLPKRCIMSDAALYAPGSFLLIYSSAKGSVLGISDPFEVKYRSARTRAEEVEVAEEAVE